MKSVIVVLLLISTVCFARASYSMETASCTGLKPGDFVRVECRWRNEEKPPTASMCPMVEARDGSGVVLYQRRIASLSRRGFLPADQAVERWQINYLVGGGKKPPADPEVFFTTLPSNTVSITASISYKGDPVTCKDIDISVTHQTLRSRAGNGRRPALEWSGRELTDEELDVALAKRDRAVAEILRDGDRTVMKMNGRKFMPRLFKLTQYDTEMRSKIPAAYTENGFNIFIAPIRVRGNDGLGMEPVWRQDGSVDVSVVKKAVRRYLRWNPNINLIVNLSIEPPRGWGEKNPTEVYRNENGEYGYWHHWRIREYGKYPEPPASKNKLISTPSYASRKWAAEMADVIGQIVSWLESAPEGKAVIGIFFSGGTDGQWLDLFDNGVKPRQMGDYSDVSRRRFKEYLKEKYGTVEKLNFAYGQSDITSFDEIEVPRMAELESQEGAFFRVHGVTRQSDYREFMTHVASEMFLTVASSVKKSSNRRLLFGGYFPHGGLSGYPLFSKNASGRLIVSEDMDFFMIVPQYIREFCDPIVSAAYDGTMVRHGKLFVRELDLRSVDSKQFWGRWKEPFWQEVHSKETFRRKATHYAMDAITHGGVYHAYDMDGGWFNSSADRASWSAVNTMTDAVRALPLIEESIAYLCGERYCNYYNSQQGRLLAYPLLEYLPKALQRSGVPWRAYLLDDILAKEKKDLPRVVLLSDATSMTAADFEKFRSVYCRDGRVIVYFWRPGLFASDGSNIDALLGLEPVSQIKGRMISANNMQRDRLTVGLKGLFAPIYFEYGAEIPELAVPKRSDWKHLLFFEDSKMPGVSVRRSSNCTEVYIALPGAITAQFCRNLAREAGFEPLVESDELCGCGSGIFYMVAQTSGEKLFRLPKGYNPDKVLAGGAFNKLPDGRFSVKMKCGDIFVLSYK